MRSFNRQADRCDPSRPDEAPSRNIVRVNADAYQAILRFARGPMKPIIPDADGFYALRVDDQVATRIEEALHSSGLATASDVILRAVGRSQ